MAEATQVRAKFRRDHMLLATSIYVQAHRDGLVHDKAVREVAARTGWKHTDVVELLAAAVERARANRSWPGLLDAYPSLSEQQRIVVGAYVRARRAGIADHDAFLQASRATCHGLGEVHKLLQAAVLDDQERVVARRCRCWPGLLEVWPASAASLGGGR